LPSIALSQFATINCRTGSGIQVRIFCWAGEARPTKNPYQFRTTVVQSALATDGCPNFSTEEAQSIQRAMNFTLLLFKI
jgi:hypothetical protein